VAFAAVVAAVTAVAAKLTVVTLFVIGLETTVPVRVIVSDAADEIPETVKSTVAAFGETTELVAVAAPAAVNVSETIAAEDGATDKRPKPIEATATSAMRLKVVFVDICFLSISQTQELPALGLGNECPLISHEKTRITRFDESHVLIHQIPHRVSGRGEETYLLVFHLHSLR
jgi:hypothetical protein